MSLITLERTASRCCASSHVSTGPPGPALTCCTYLFERRSTVAAEGDSDLTALGIAPTLACIVLWPSWSLLHVARRGASFPPSPSGPWRNERRMNRSGVPAVSAYTAHSGAACWARRSRTRGRRGSDACPRFSTRARPATALCSSGPTSKDATREAVIEAGVRRIAIWRASKACLTERDETSPRWVCDVLGLTRLRQRTSWQDGRFGLDRGASRLLATVN